MLFSLLSSRAWLGASSMVILSLAAAGCSGSDTGGVGSSGGNGGGTGNGQGSGTGTGTGTGTGSGSAGDALFQSPSSTSATPDSIFGLWGGSLQPGDGWTFDTRIEMAAGSITFATRCTSPDGRTGGIASVSAKARISNDDISVLESKSDEKKLGDVTCRANATPGETKACTPDQKGFEQTCFTLEGTSLTIYGATTFDKLAMTKISD